ncbi:MAG: hypothetical protein AAGE01_14915 [Pseudomonadota bacterium]
MAERELDWNALGQVWREPPADPLPDLLATLHRRTRRIWILTACDVIATLGLLYVVYLLAHDGLGVGEGWLIGLILFGVGLGWAATLAARHGTWRRAGDDPESVVALAIRRCRASILLARFNQAAILLGFALGVIMGASEVVLPDFDLGIADGAKVAVRIGALSLFVGWFATSEWYARRKQRERDRLIQLQGLLRET